MPVAWNKPDEEGHYLAVYYNFELAPRLAWKRGVPRVTGWEVYHHPYGEEITDPRIGRADTLREAKGVCEDYLLRAADSYVEHRRLLREVLDADNHLSAPLIARIAKELE